MTTYIVVAEDKDGIWYDDPDVTETLQVARAMAKHMEPEKGYEAVIYELSFVESFPNKPPVASESTAT